LLDPHRTVQRLDAVVLSGGSAFGLAAADGVMQWLEQRGVGYPTATGPVPIVVGASLFDLAVGDSSVRPGPAAGFAACEAAGTDDHRVGPVGAGAGATVNKWRGAEHRRGAGIGHASLRHGALVVGAIVALNAFGDVDAVPTEQSMASLDDALSAGFGNTTLAVVATNAILDKAGCLVVAQGGHDGFARALFPPHTRVDGDAVVAAATGAVEAGVDAVRALAVQAVEAAVRQAGALR
jgi:L-aminopeptidase/D-esterase-like protein